VKTWNPFSQKIDDVQLAYQEVFGASASASGKIVLADLFKETGFVLPGAVKSDPHMTYYNEGSRSVVSRILLLAYGPESSEMEVIRLVEDETASINDARGEEAA